MKFDLIGGTMQIESIDKTFLSFLKKYKIKEKDLGEYYIKLSKTKKTIFLERKSFDANADLPLEKQICIENNGTITSVVQEEFDIPYINFYDKDIKSINVIQKRENDKWKKYIKIKSNSPLYKSNTLILNNEKIDFKKIKKDLCDKDFYDRLEAYINNYIKNQNTNFTKEIYNLYSNKNILCLIMENIKFKKEDVKIKKDKDNNKIEFDYYGISGYYLESTKTFKLDNSLTNKLKQYKDRETVYYRIIDLLKKIKLTNYSISINENNLNIIFKMNGKEKRIKFEFSKTSYKKLEKELNKIKDEIDDFFEKNLKNINIDYLNFAFLKYINESDFLSKEDIINNFRAEQDKYNIEISYKNFLSILKDKKGLLKKIKKAFDFLVNWNLIDATLQPTMITTTPLGKLFLKQTENDEQSSNIKKLMFLAKTIILNPNDDYLVKYLHIFDDYYLPIRYFKEITNTFSHCNKNQKEKVHLYLETMLSFETDKINEEIIKRINESF